MQMAGGVEVSIVVWSRYITLRLFWRTLKNEVIKGPLSHMFHQAFYKTFVNLRFWNKESSFAPIFIMIDWKHARYKESSIPTKWVIMHEICCGSESLSKMKLQTKYKIGITLDPDLTLTCSIF